MRESVLVREGCLVKGAFPGRPIRTEALPVPVITNFFEILRTKVTK